MVNITRAEAAALGRRSQQPVKTEGELLAIWCPGILKNPLNGPQYGRQKFVKMRYRREWKERVTSAIFEAEEGNKRMVYSLPFAERMAAAGPKHVTFLASTHNAMDSDGLQAALKPVRDALVECGVVSGDAERDGHVWEYHQRIDRQRRGIEVRVRLRDPGARR